MFAVAQKCKHCGEHLDENDCSLKSAKAGNSTSRDCVRITGHSRREQWKVVTVAVGTTIADRPPRRSVRARLRIRLLLWMNGGETCCWPHTVQSLGHALPALCRTHVGWNDVLLSLCPSLPGLRRRLLPFVVRLVHGYYGTVRLLLYVHVRSAALAFADRSWSVDQDVQEISRFSCMLFLSVRGFLDYAGPSNPLAICVVAVLPSSTRNGVGVLFHRLFEAQ